ncbi:MAG: MraY family glycosyltransferase, partial [Pirellulales bacterium]
MASSPAALPLTTLFLIAAAAFFASTLATPLVRALARRCRLTDRPDGHRKLHGQAVPLGGGLAVLVAAGLTIALALLLSEPVRLLLLAKPWELAALLAASAVIVFVGLVDDRVGLRGRHKLLGQLCAAGILLAAGLVIKNVSVFEFDIRLGLLAVPFTIFWLLGAMNSVNLIDGVDGLATTVGVILSLAIAAMAHISGHPAEALLALAFAASLLGFLCFNRPPARIYLGDAGSLLIGLVVGALAIRATLKGPATVALAAPLAIWAIPIFDSLAAIIRRKLTGRSIYTTDRGHLHHCLLAAYGDNVRVVIGIALCCAVTCLGALLSVWLHNDLLAILTALTVVATLIATRAFGHVELQLVASRLRALGLSMLHPMGAGPLRTHQAAIRLQGSRQWELLWDSLTEFAGKLNLSAIRLDVNLPAVQEGYHASWRRDSLSTADDIWRAEVPLLAGARPIGRLYVEGRHDGISACELIERLMDLLQPFESQLIELAQLPATGPVSLASSRVPGAKAISVPQSSSIPPSPLPPFPPSDSP